MITFANWLKDQRKILNWTQADLAERVGCYSRTVTGWELGENLPTSNTASRIERAMGIVPGELVARIKDARKKKRSANMEGVRMLPKAAPPSLWGAPLPAAPPSEGDMLIPAHTADRVRRLAARGLMRPHDWLHELLVRLEFQSDVLRRILPSSQSDSINDLLGDFSPKPKDDRPKGDRIAAKYHRD